MPPMAKTRPIGILVLIVSLAFASATGNSASGSPESILVNCGSSGTSVDGDSRAWSGDEGGSPFLSTATAVPASSQGSVSATPYLTARISSFPFTYSIPVIGDRYFVRLYFYPSGYGKFSASDAVFDVLCGPYTLLKNFNTSYYSQALNLDSIVREYSLDVSSAGGKGWLNFTFTPSTNFSSSYAFVNGIELVSMPNLFSAGEDLYLVGTQSSYSVDPDAAVETMYRLNVGGGSVPLDKDSGQLNRVWSEDSNYIAGAALGITYEKDENVSIKYPPSVPEYIAPASVYKTARSMPWYNSTANLVYNLSWILTLDPGFYYLVRLHFCEIQHPFTFSNQRVFTVYVNNHTAVQDFDVISRSSSIGVPVYFDCITVIPDGKEPVDVWVSLHPYLQFQPQYTNVILNGLEVFKLSNYFGSLAASNPSPLLHPSVAPVRYSSREDCNSNWVHLAGAVGAFVSAIGALSLMSMLVYLAYHRGWPPLPVSSSKKPLKDAITGSSSWSSYPVFCRNFTSGETKDNAEVAGLLAARKLNVDDDIEDKDFNK